MMLAVSGATDPAQASAFIKQCGDVLEYLLYIPAILARLAFAAGASHRVGQLVFACFFDTCLTWARLISFVML
jgi:hypothetical protein